MKTSLSSVTHVSHYVRCSLACSMLLAATASAVADEASSPVTFDASYTGESAFLVSGGKDAGSAYAGQFYGGARIDLEQLLGWQDATIKIDVASRHGDNLAVDEIGNTTSIQEIYGGQGQRLANLTLQKEWQDGRILWEGGRSVANIHFLGSDLCAYFQVNAACGNPTFVFRTSNFTWWPVSSWAMHTQVWVTPEVYVHAGVYEVNPTQAEEGRHGFDWSTADATGVITPVAIGYQSAPGAARSAFYEVGGWYDTSDYNDPLRDENGDPAVISGNDYAEDNGRAGFFARFEQGVYETDAAGRGLTVFGAWLTGLKGELVEDNFLQLGLVKYGTFASRPRDTIGFVAATQFYSDETMDDLTYARAQAGGTGTPEDFQTMVELSYGIQVTPGLRVQPNLQYIAHPDQLGEPGRTQDLEDGFAIGLRVDWNMKDGIEALFAR